MCVPSRRVFGISTGRTCSTPYAIEKLRPAESPACLLYSSQVPLGTLYLQARHWDRAPRPGLEKGFSGLGTEDGAPYPVLEQAFFATQAVPTGNALIATD